MYLPGTAEAAQNRCCCVLVNIWPCSDLWNSWTLIIIIIIIIVIYLFISELRLMLLLGKIWMFIIQCVQKMRLV